MAIAKRQAAVLAKSGITIHPDAHTVMVPLLLPESGNASPPFRAAKQLRQQGDRVVSIHQCNPTEARVQPKHQIRLCRRRRTTLHYW